MSFSIYLGYAVVAVMLIASGVFFFSSEDNAFMQGKNQYLLGSIFLIYAAFRYYRIRIASKKASTQQDENHD